MALILVVDDEKDACRLVERILSASGHQVHGFTEAAAAMQWLEERRPDLAILDIKLQAADGISLLEALRKREPLMKVIMITGYPSVETASKAQLLGVEDYMVKPLEIDEFEKRVNKVLRSEQKEADTF
jgi:two-component system response regulator RegA